MSNEEWKIKGVGYVANKVIQYDWSYMKTECDITQLSQEQQTELTDEHWYKHGCFLTGNATEQTELESSLNKHELIFTTVNVAPTEDEKSDIIAAGVRRTDEIKPALELGKTLRTNMHDQAHVMQDMMKVMRK